MAITRVDDCRAFGDFAGHKHGWAVFVSGI
jgi:hypothetical protein